MTKPILVGSFVLGGLALAVFAVAFFGGAHLFAKQVPVVVVFEHSIAGLEVGAPVTFRGMRVGRVEEMRVHIDVRHQRSWIPVYLGLDLDQVEWVDGPGGTRADLQAAVDAGLRAQLVSQGLVSGQMSVNLDYHPGTRANLQAHEDRLVEIPTIPSELQNLKDELEHLDLPQIAANTQQVLKNMQRVLDDLDGKIGPLADNVQSSLAATTAAVRTLQSGAARTLADIDQLALAGRDQLNTNGRDLDELLKKAELTTDQADSLVASLGDMTSARGDLQASLRDLAASASSLRSLTHDLQRNPLGTLLRKDAQ
jgi:paraquat-inducible protein B